MITPDAKGKLVFAAAAAQLHGNNIKTEAVGDQENIGYWDDAKDWASWSA